MKELSMVSSEYQKVWNLNTHTLNEEYLTQKLNEDQSLVESDLSKLHEVCLYWYEIGDLAVRFLFDHNVPITNRILCFIGAKVLKSLPKIDSQEKAVLFFEYLFHCLEKKVFTINELKKARKIFKKIPLKLRGNMYSHCRELFSVSFREINEMNFVNFRSKKHDEDILICMNTKWSSFQEALQSGAGVMGISIKRDFNDPNSSPYEYFSKWQILFDHGFRDSRFYFPYSEPGFGIDENYLDFVDYLKVCFFIASYANRDFNAYFVGKLDTFKL